MTDSRKFARFDAQGYAIGFWVEGVARVPEDVVQITDQEYEQLLTDQGDTLRMVAGQIVEGPPRTYPTRGPALVELKSIDMQSVRAIREYIAAQPDAPARLVDLEAAAVTARTLL